MGMMLTTTVSGTPSTPAPEQNGSVPAGTSVTRFAILPPAREMQFSAFHHPRFRLTRPIRLGLEARENAAVVRWMEGNVEASASSLGAALLKFRAVLFARVEAGDPNVLPYLLPR